MNDLPAKRKRKLGVAPTKPQFVPGCTHFAPKCTQCKTKGLLQNESLKLYHYLSHFTKKPYRSSTVGLFPFPWERKHVVIPTQRERPFLRRKMQAPNRRAWLLPKKSWSGNPGGRRCWPWWKSRCGPAIPESASWKRRWPVRGWRRCGASRAGG